MIRYELSLNEVRNIINQTIREVNNQQLRSFYVACSSYFDTHSYNINQIVKALKRAGGRNITTDNAYGWSNQPEVVVFDAPDDMVEDISAQVAKRLGTDWVLIKEKDW